MQDIELSEEAKRALEILAELYERDPSTRLEGVDQHKLGAMVGTYLNISIYFLAELKHAGFVSRIGKKVFITQEGYRYIRPKKRRYLEWLRLDNPFIYIAVLILAAVIAGLILRC